MTEEQNAYEYAYPPTTVEASRTPVETAEERCETCGWVVSWCACDEPVSPPLQEGGGWARDPVLDTSWIDERAVWFHPKYGTARVPVEVEAAIRAEAADEAVRDVRGLILRTDAVEAENRRLQTTLDEAQAALTFATEGWRLDKERARDSAQWERDRYRTALERIRYEAGQSGHSGYHVADEALRATQAPSEEK